MNLKFTIMNILFKVTTHFGLYHQAIIRSQDEVVPKTDNLRYLQFYIFTVLHWL